MPNRAKLVLAVCGTAAAGKSTLATALSEAYALPALSADGIRKLTAGVAPNLKAPDTAYREETSLQTYALLGVAARGVRACVVDATFRRAPHRGAFVAAYGRHDVLSVIYVQCVAPPATILERARRRDQDGASISDADAGITAAMLADFDPLNEVPAACHLLVRTDRPIGSVLADLTALIDARLSMW
jgi:uncharacterized protein